jgi:hypothetical protein
MLLSALIAAIGHVAVLKGSPGEYQKEIGPILEQACAKCHAGNVAMGGLLLDSEAAILRGGKSGPAIVPGNSGSSLLIKRILGTDGAPRMPMGGQPLPQNQVDQIRRWIDRNDFAQARAELQKQGSEQATPADEVRQSPLFQTKVRPILAARCYVCHGPDAQQNGLRLDSLAAILKGSESGKVVVRGHGDQSRLVRRLLAKERPQMPYGGPPLSKDQIADIRAWIDAGAPGPDSTEPIASGKQLKHWAYMKPMRPVVPVVKDAAWPRNPIDNFILARLEKEGLKPEPEADKATLIRRVYLDLVGLPPSPQEVDAFVADTSPDAYDKVVDRLLASPHYGERWARPWLDLARYADTNGYEKDGQRVAWSYRDWLIKALNSDMSFREFTIEQIAGDMLPNRTQDQLIATGFNRNTMLNQEGGVDPEEYYWYELVDRANTTASVWLGSTLACAQCHNHKFDPFTQKDYYRFLAFFSNSEYKIVGEPSEQFAQEPDLELPTAEQAKASKAIRASMAKLEETLKTQTPRLDAAQRDWETQMRAVEAKWATVTPIRQESSGGAKLTVQADGSVLAEGPNPQADKYTLEGKAALKEITAVRLEVLSDKSLPNDGPGRDAEGNFFLSDFDIEAAPADKPQAKQHIVWKSVKADESQSGYDASNLSHKVTRDASDQPTEEANPLRKEKVLRGWAIDQSSPDRPKERQAVFVADEPFGFASGTVLTITMKHEMRHATRNIGRFRISVTSEFDPNFVVTVPARDRPILSINPDKRTSEQKERLSAAYRETSPFLDDTRKQLAKLKDSLKKLNINTAMTLRERPSFLRPAAYIRERGSFTSKGDVVYADVPSALNPLSRDMMPNRLGFAEWLVSEDNPLTARVTVNRFWETIFGHGIVETAEDFGTQGDPPTHPELLDWLATEFMRDGWSMKKIQRLIVTSATYRQSSVSTPDRIARDPYNKLYARGPRFREEAEMVHDIALSAAGLLSPKMYGPSMFPYQPEGIWDVPYSDEKWIQSKGEDQYRRSIYTFMRRSAPYPSLSTYDAPSREFCTVRRVRTNTPLQALTSLNDPYFFDVARGVARRMTKEGGAGNTERATYGFRLCVSRKPASGELSSILSFYQEQLSRYKQDKQAAGQVIGENADQSVDPADLAAWTMVANVLLNMDETISKE